MKILKLVLLFIVIILASCTENRMARNYGGTSSFTLEPNEKFINITWKGDDLWIIVQDTVSGIYYAKEKSSYGLMEGKIIINSNNK